ncbi:hypothetical protein BGZ99_005212 [Dissophora globulifera]|uniref:Uncharacterized protein n=1 Tax=Dissophora globulifera TaxID=979702 RepID=A0A9P6UU31_9FUNG|nr:hypothetical protein BGZ99_005212 [Dissophora globulifera]
MQSAPTLVVDGEIRKQFHRDGFVILQNALSAGDVDILRREVDCLVNFLISEGIDIMKDLGGIIEPISCGYIDPPVSQMYILSKRSYSSLRNMVTEDPDTMVPILFDKITALAKNFLPPETLDYPMCLFNEQYIVKTPNTPETSSFKWHNENGTLLIEPFPRPIDSLTGEYLTDSSLFGNDSQKGDNDDGFPKYLQHHMDLAAQYEEELHPDAAIIQAQARPQIAEQNSAKSMSRSKVKGKSQQQQSQVLYERQNAVLVDIPAGSIVILSGFVRHCSLGNKSPRFRRAYMPQFSAGKVIMPENGGFVSLAVPCSAEQDQERERLSELALKRERELDMEIEEDLWLDDFTE